MAERLQTALARAGLASRRAADQWIAEGRVTVNGAVALPGTRIEVARDVVAVEGRRVDLGPSDRVHLAIHKPRGVLSAAAATRGRPAVVDLVHPRPARRLWPAGRLDVDSEGLMLLTDDGAWANRVLHPRYGVRRTYAVRLDRRPARADLERLRTGIELEDGLARALSARVTRRPAEIEPESDAAREAAGAWLRVEMGEGRKREVRRLFAALGYRVRRLVRVGIGPITLAGLAPAEWRPLTAAEVAALGGAPARKGATATRTRRRSRWVAVDGTSGSGKSTVGRALAERIGARFLDTGLLYRAVTWAALDAGIDPDDSPALARLAERVRIRIRPPASHGMDALDRVELDGRDVTPFLRDPAVERAVPAVSQHAAVRRAMLNVQRDAARGRDTVMVGRDIGTVVLPDADLKVFLTASAAVRARRRAAQMGRPDREAAYRREIEARDRIDSTRAVAPLRRAPGALVLDTGELDVAACVAAIIAALRERPAR